MNSNTKITTYLKENDSLCFNEDKQIRKFIRDETILFSDVISKKNHYGITQQRSILITNKAIYNIDKKELKRKIDIKNVKGLTSSTETDEFVLHCVELEHDYHFMHKNKKKLIEIINDIYYFNNNNFLPFCSLNAKSLDDYVTLKKEKKKDISFSRMSQNGHMHVEIYLHGKILSIASKDIDKSEYLDFRVMNVIGRGTVAKILLVEHIISKENYALKVLRKDSILKNLLLDNFETEKKILNSIDNTFIIKSLAFFQTKERLYFLLPFIKGGDMYQHLRNVRVLDEEQVRFYASQILLALDTLHKYSIIYRDLKPENILIEEDGYIKLTDFGTSKKLENNITKTYTFCGTPEYISPEIISNEGHSKSTDYWSLGILMYEMLFGEPPFYDEDIERTYELIANAELKIHSQRLKISQECEDLLIKLLDKNPETRLGSGLGFNEIKSHPFFESVNFEGIVNKEIEAPYKPHVLNNYDLSFFPDEFVNEEINDSYIDYDSTRIIEKNKDVFNEMQ